MFVQVKQIIQKKWHKRCVHGDRGHWKHRQRTDYEKSCVNAKEVYNLDYISD